MDLLLEHLARELGGAYLIERELGGGMSRVFVVTDKALNRRVVLKVLSAELARDVSGERFKREILLAARLQHAHIVPLLTAGEADGVPWFTMPFIDGQSLRARLGSGKLAIAETVRILHDVASALAYAHAHGVVHRDVKPENILLDAGAAFVSDFGVSKAVTVAAAERGLTLTSVGVALGTPAYMAPEQIAAEQDADHRADIYAFGVVAYEMLAGRNPFARQSTQATMAAHMTETPPPIEAEGSSTTATLSQLVSQCLAKSPADRPQHAAEIVNVLDALSPLVVSAEPAGRPSIARHRRIRGPSAIGVAAFVLCVGTWIGWRMLNRPELDAHRVAVVPFANLTGDSTLAIVGRVAAEELSRSVAQTDSANVISDAAIREVIGVSSSLTDAQVNQLARATRAGVIVTGSYIRIGDSLRVQASVIDARRGRVARALDPSDGPVRDPMVAIGGLRERLLGSIVSGEAARAVVVGSAPPKYTAYLEMLEGRRAFMTDPKASRQYFERAIALDSMLLPAYSQLVLTYTSSGLFDDAERVIAPLDGQRERLSSYDRLGLAFLHGYIRRVADEILPLARDMYARSQDPFAAYQAGTWALRVLQPGRALVALQHADSVMTSQGWAIQARDVALAHHQLGQYRAELAALERGTRLVPAGAVGYRHSRLRAFAGLDDSRSALALADSLLRDGDDEPLARATAVRVGAREFAGHGDDVTAKRLIDMVLEWLHGHSMDTSTRARDDALGFAWFDRGNLDSAEAHFRQPATDTGDARVDRAGYLGVIAARRGDTTRARIVADSLAGQQRKWDLGLSPWWRAAITAQLGRRDESLQLLRQARTRGQSMIDWHAHPALAVLRGYAPFEEMIQPKR